MIEKTLLIVHFNTTAGAKTIANYEKCYKPINSAQLGNE